MAMFRKCPSYAAVFCSTSRRLLQQGLGREVELPDPFDPHAVPVDPVVLEEVGEPLLYEPEDSWTSSTVPWRFSVDTASRVIDLIPRSWHQLGSFFDYVGPLGVADVYGVPPVRAHLLFPSRIIPMWLGLGPSSTCQVSLFS